MGNLLVLDPAFASLPEKEFLNGELAQGRKVVRVWTDNWNISNGLAFPLCGAHGGAIHYRNALKKYKGTPADPTWTLTHSRGGSVAMKTLREWIDWLIANGVDPAANKIVMCGCPDAKFVGGSYVRPTIDKAVYPGAKAHNIFCPTPPQFHGGYGYGFGLPLNMTNFPVEIWIVIQEFDGWADAPITTNHAETRRFYTPGGLPPAKNGPTSPHTSTNPNNYRKSLWDSTNVVYTDPAQPNVHYVWLRTKIIPSMANDLDNYNRNEYERIYPLIQPDYSNRPVTLPMLAA